MSYEPRRQQHQYTNVNDYSSRGHQQDYEPFTQKLYHSAPSTRQTVKFLTATTIGTVLLILSALILTGTVLSLILATPALVLVSPILVPAAITVFFLASGFLFSGGCGVAALSALSWIYQYVTGQHPVGADQLDRARMRIGDAAWEVKEKAKENLQYVQNKAHEATHQQTTTTATATA